MIVLRNAAKLKRIMGMERKQKLQVATLAVMMILGAFLETMGVSMVVPLVLIVTQPGVIERNPILKAVCNMCGIYTEKTLVLAVIAGLAVIFILKGFFLLAEYQMQFKFVHENKLSMQRRLLQIYLNRPYEYFLGTNFSEILQNITENTNAAFTVFSHILGFFMEAIVSLFLAITIFLIDPMMTVLVGIVLFLLVFFLLHVIRHILEQEGRKKQKYGAQMSKWLLQAIHGIKEIKILRKENYFLENYIETGRKLLEAERRNAILNRVPRILIESFSVSAMLLGMALLILSGNDVNKILPALSAFAMAAVRLMPSAHRMVTYMNELAYYEPALDRLEEHFESLEAEQNVRSARNLWSGKCATKGKDGKQDLSVANNKPEKFFLKKGILLSGISYHYPNLQKNVLENVDMYIPVGKSVGIVGISGAGKTTAVDILLGLLKPQIGKVLVDEVDVEDFYEEWLSYVGYIPQMIFMLDDSIRGNVAFGVQRDEIDDDRVWEVLEEAQLAEFVRNLPGGLDTEIGERGVRLSGGQRQRIGIARALYAEPEVLIFDEATSALDRETEAAMLESIRRLQGRKTMVIIAHRLETIAVCDVVYRVEDGKIWRNWT